MGQAMIIYSNDPQVTNDEQIKQVVVNEPNSFSTLIIEGKLTVIIKEVEEDKQSYDKIRMVAGDVARALSNRKVDEASIREQDVQALFSKGDRKSTRLN